MKNIVLILLLILACAGCKDDEEVEPEAETEVVAYEEWTKLSSDVISLNSRNVISMETYDSSLYIQCLNSFYHLDQDLNLLKNSLKPLEREPSRVDRPKIGDKWTIRKADTDFPVLSFDIFFTQSPISNTYWKSVFIDSLGVYRFGGTHTAVDENEEFGVLYNTHFGDSLYHYYNSYRILDGDREAELLYSLKLGTYRIGDSWWSVKDATHIDGVSYCSYDIRTARIENGKITHRYDHYLRDVSKYNGGLVAISDKFRSDPSRVAELLISYDNGITWEDVFIGRSLMFGNLKVIDDEIFLINNSYVLILNVENGTFKEVNLEGTDAYIKDVEKIGGKAVLGTDHGLYYKSWESFLNK
jgi:hypothetical protein